MVIPLVLELVAVALLGLVWARARAQGGSRQGRPALVTAMALLVASMAINGLALAGVGGSGRVAAALLAGGGGGGGQKGAAAAWLKEHEKEMPAPDAVGVNMRVIGDARTFLRARRQTLSPETAALVESAAGAPTRPDHMLSGSEERRYYELASSLVEAIRAMAQ